MVIVESVQALVYFFHFRYLPSTFFGRFENSWKKKGRTGLWRRSLRLSRTTRALILTVVCRCFFFLFAQTQYEYAWHDPFRNRLLGIPSTHPFCAIELICLFSCGNVCTCVLLILLDCILGNLCIWYLSEGNRLLSLFTQMQQCMRTKQMKRGGHGRHFLTIYSQRRRKEKKRLLQCADRTARPISFSLLLSLLYLFIYGYSSVRSA